MRLYHRTTQYTADLILREGFRVDTWFSTLPSRLKQDAAVDALLIIVMDCDEDDLSCGSEDDGSLNREWRIPPDIVNSKADCIALVEDRETIVEDLRIKGMELRLAATLYSLIASAVEAGPVEGPGILDANFPHRELDDLSARRARFEATLVATSNWKRAPAAGCSPAAEPRTTHSVNVARTKFGPFEICERRRPYETHCSWCTRIIAAGAVAVGVRRDGKHLTKFCSDDCLQSWESIQWQRLASKRLGLTGEALRREKGVIAHQKRLTGFGW